ncbi:GTPase HflX [Candidatus Uhrbacteria bacterium]|nr:GTPase HflX [Candidatus Uhrbacteria bacterium]
MKVSKKPHVVLIDVIPTDLSKEVATRRITELESLVKTYGGLVVVEVIQKRSIPDYNTYIGSGKLEQAIVIAKEKKAELLIINNLLKPKQMFAIGDRLRKEKLRVWDRVDLILKIFDKHAKTSEAKLQIKLAALRHMGPRIFGMGMEMMQQAGGIGGRGGQGESNTEMMKRHLFEQEKTVVKHLEQAAQSRRVHRERRRRIGFKTASIVGYTNAGKSSLLNALTQKVAYVADALFATLDTRVSKLWMPENKQEILLSDTIGFIQDLPPQLIQAFRSTLDETVDADVLLHVIDVGDPFMHEKIAEVEDILKSLDVLDRPTIFVFNKIDKSKKIPRATLRKKYKKYTPVFVSAHSGEGLEELKKQIGDRMMNTS